MADHNEVANIESADGIISMLDQVETRVEMLRKQAQTLAEEKQELLKTLNNLQESSWLANLGPVERCEVEANTDRLICRCLTVDILVSSPRNSTQETAVNRITQLLDTLQDRLLNYDINDAINTVKIYINACDSGCSGNTGPIDQKFEAILMDCTADDQKWIKKKLLSWLEEFQISSETLDETGADSNELKT